MKLTYFRAAWCGVCHAKVSVVEEIAASMRLPLESWDWDSGDGRARAEALRVRTVPTLALVDGERVRFRLVGAMITPENVRHLTGMTDSRRPT